MPAKRTIDGPQGADRNGRSAEAGSLDAAAALLIQLEPTDVEEIEELCRMLEDLAISGGLEPMAQSRVAGAARCLAEAESEGRVAESLAKAGQLLEDAMSVEKYRPRSPSATHAGDEAGADALEVDPSLLSDFLAEAREYLEEAEAALLALEHDPESPGAVDVVFRAFHTLKGTSAFLGLERISELAHHAESLFQRFRDGEVRCDGPRADASLRTVDMLQTLLNAVEHGAGDDPSDVPQGYAALLQMLSDPEAAGLLQEGSESLPGKRIEDGTGPMAERMPICRPADDQLRAFASETASEASVRVRTDRLDGLVDMVGELVIAHTMVAQDPAVAVDEFSPLGRKVAQVGKIVRELQDLSVSMRMVPLRTTFQRMSRLVRDVARKSGKTVEFVTAGEETEIDRNMVDLLGDPLVHMLRNAIDHGLESAEERTAKGKPGAGRIELRAYQAGGNVVLELSDDGRGLDRKRILKRAVERRLIDPEEHPSDAQVWQLIFAPGFSTADQVTDLSGRGVGMDVVKKNLESVHGRVEIASEPDRGTTFTLRLPLTLAVTDGMLVRVSDERFILPTTNIRMSFRPSSRMLSTVAGKGEMVLLRDELLPVLRLNRLFGIDGGETDPTQALLVVVGFGEQQCALLVDELLGQQQVVAKSLGRGLGKVTGVTGGAVLGDGRVGLILDIPEMLALFRRGESKEAAGKGR